MTPLAHPADLPVGVRRHLLGGQTFIGIRVPLPCDVGTLGGQVVESSQHPCAGADRAAMHHPAGRARIHTGLPFMPTGAQPPNLRASGRRHVRWGQTSILRGVPLLRQFGMDGRQIVDTSRQSAQSRTLLVLHTIMQKTGTGPPSLTARSLPRRLQLFRVGSEGSGSASASLLTSHGRHGADSYSASVSGNFLRICALVRFGRPQP